MDSLYTFAKLGRAGLANRLFPWARSEIFRETHGIQMLAPQWTQLKIGPLLRREKDKRYYVNLFDQSSYVRGVKKHWILLKSQQIAEDNALETMKSSKENGKSKVVIFSDIKDFFLPFLPHQPFISLRLQSILSAHSKRVLANSPLDYTIAAHVRRGDMPPLKEGQRPKIGVNATLPDEWYIGAIKSVRRALGQSARVKIFSDAPVAELQKLLSLPNVSLAEPNASIVDIFRLSMAKVLITTSSSTFSMWASFLGQMPTLWYPEMKQSLNLAHPTLDIETDTDGSISSSAAQYILNHITA